MAGETKILRIIGYESQVETFFLIHHHRIHNVILIEIDTRIRNRTIERVLKETEAVLININILEHIFQYSRQHIARIKQFIDSRRVNTFYNRLFIVGIFPVQFLRHRFVHRNRQNILTRHAALLHLVTEERILLKQVRFTQRVGCNII